MGCLWSIQTVFFFSKLPGFPLPIPPIEDTEDWRLGGGGGGGHRGLETCGGGGGAYLISLVLLPLCGLNRKHTSCEIWRSCNCKMLLTLWHLMVLFRTILSRSVKNEQLDVKGWKGNTSLPTLDLLTFIRTVVWDKKENMVTFICVHHSRFTNPNMAARSILRVLSPGSLKILNHCLDIISCSFQLAKVFESLYF